MKRVYPEAEAPEYEIILQDFESSNEGIRLVSLVKHDKPAIGVEGMYFTKDKVELKKYEFKKIKDKKLIVGPAMIPDIRIKREDEDGSIFFVFMSKETIVKLVNKFNRDNTGKSINIQHTSSMAPAYISQNWIIEDSYYDKSKKYGYSLPIGTWFVECMVEDEEFFEKDVKEGGLYSFSIEGILSQKPVVYNSIENMIDLLSFEDIKSIILN